MARARPALFDDWPYATIFVAVFLLNLLPAFAPPAWMALSVIGFTTPELPIFRVALTAVVAATAGRYALAKMARWLFTRLDWGDLFNDRKLRLTAKGPVQAP